MGNEVMTGIPVAHFGPAADFYARVLGRAPDFVAMKGREVLWQDFAITAGVLDPRPRELLRALRVAGGAGDLPQQRP